jgi:acyl-CoA synthetase (AMP-forming)/AMP-acid ligase II
VGFSPGRRFAASPQYTGAVFVSPRLGTATAGKPIEHARQHLPKVKYPREVRIVPSVPLASVGKPGRKKPRERP